jgi:secreted PhoX family phosphatase
MTVAGTGTLGYSGDGGPATRAQLATPTGIAVDRLGNVYLSEDKNQRVRKVDHVTGVITTVAGTGKGGYSGDGGPGASAQLNNPQGLAVDPAGDYLYIAEFWNCRVRRLNLKTGIIDTVAGTGECGYSGDGGAATNAKFASPVGVAVDSAGNLFIVDAWGQRVREVDHRTGVISTVVGNGQNAFSGDGGPATQASLSFPVGPAVDAAGNLYVSGDQRIRRIDGLTGNISTLAGDGTSGFSGDGGLAAAAKLNNPTFLALDSSGNLLVVDQFNNRVRAISLKTDTITTVAGSGAWGFSGDGGPATAAAFNHPVSVAVGPDGALYVGDKDNLRVRRVGPGDPYSGERR